MQAQEEVVTMIKGKRSKRPRLSSPLTLTIATTSSSTAEIGGGLTDFSGSSDRLTTPSPSNSAGELIQRLDEEEEDMAHCLILLAKGHVQRCPPPPSAVAEEVKSPTVEVYQCKTCNKTFPSFQALGGHRASHKKPNKLVLTLEDKKALREDLRSSSDDNTVLSLQISNRVFSSPHNKSKVHECSICGAEFASGQALGGHMRRHRPIPAAASGSHGESQELKRPRNLLSLDLNLPAPEDDHTESKFPFAPKDQVIVFSTSSLVDCHY